MLATKILACIAWLTSDRRHQTVTIPLVLSPDLGSDGEHNHAEALKRQTQALTPSDTSAQSRA